MIKSKIISAQRYLKWNYLPQLNSNIRINEFPRSGGTWLAKMLSDLYQLPFPQKSLLPIERCIEHTHYRGPFNHKTIVVLRDGRDVMTSAYFHFLMYAPNKSSSLVEHWREKISYQENLEAKAQIKSFIQIFSENFKVGGRQTSWSDHAMSINSSSPVILVVKYEDMLTQCSSVLNNIIHFLEIEPIEDVDTVITKNSFENLARRKRGQEKINSFYRKGIAGDWKNYFDEETLELFMSLHGEAMRYWKYD